MQVVCSNCQLSFQAPEGATGLACPICRSPLRPADGADGGGQPPAESPRQTVDWNGGSLDELVALLSAPSWSARVEVLQTGSDTPVGEVHVIAGGVSDAIHAGQSTHDALDKLRAVKGARFRVEPRLPNPSDGDLARPGPDQGRLEERPLATLMRYCEDYVLTCSIEVWRASEDAKVEYRRGEIVGVTVGGIDAPERLAEVMKWASGSYRLRVPKLSLSETAPKAAPAAPAAVVAARSTGAAGKTIFGMPALDPAAISAAADKAKASQAQKGAPAAATAPGMRPAAAPVEAQPPAAVAAAPTLSDNSKQAVAKTIFGVQAPVVAASSRAAASPAAARPAAAASAPTASPTGSPPATSSPAVAPATVETSRPSRPAAPTVQAASAAPAAAAARTAAPRTQTAAPSKTANTATTAVDRTAPTKVSKRRPGETPVWTYVGVGFIFGMALLGVYRLVLVLAH